MLHENFENLLELWYLIFDQVPLGATGAEGGRKPAGGPREGVLPNLLYARRARKRRRLVHVLASNANGARAQARLDRPDQHIYKIMAREGAMASKPPKHEWHDQTRAARPSRWFTIPNRAKVSLLKP